MRRIVPLIVCALALVSCSSNGSDSTAEPTSTVAATQPTDTTPADTTPSDTVPPDTTGTTVSLADRPFDVFVPSSYQEGSPAPLLVLLHGYGATGAIQEGYLGLQAIAEARGFLYVHPDGTKNVLGDPFWNATDACCQRLQENIDDVGYLMALVDDVSTRFDVDPKRVWFAGHSNGAFMSHRLACEQADHIAAIVSLAGATWADPSKCSPSEPVSVLQIHGTADLTIQYEGGSLFGRDFPSAMQTVETWSQKNACGALSPVDGTLDLDGGIDGAESTVMSAADCPAGISVDLWTIAGGGHIPSLSATFAQQVVDWLYAHPKP